MDKVKLVDCRLVLEGTEHSFKIPEGDVRKLQDALDKALNDTEEDSMNIIFLNGELKFRPSQFVSLIINRKEG